jgi:transcriptional regulator with XRE-family HTH domain
MTNVPFGSRLRSLREHARMSLAQLAELADTDASRITRWERNLEVPEFATVERLAIALGVSGPTLLIGRAPPKA